MYMRQTPKRLVRPAEGTRPQPRGRTEERGLLVLTLTIRGGCLEEETFEQMMRTEAEIWAQGRGSLNAMLGVSLDEDVSLRFCEHRGVSVSSWQRRRDLDPPAGEVKGEGTSKGAVTVIQIGGDKGPVPEASVMVRSLPGSETGQVLTANWMSRSKGR